MQHCNTLGSHRKEPFENMKRVLFSSTRNAVKVKITENKNYSIIALISTQTYLYTKVNTATQS